MALLQVPCRSRAAVATLRAQSGAAFVDLLLCFLADKPFAFDPLNVGMVPGEDHAGLRRDVKATRFGAIQVSPAKNCLAPATLAAVARLSAAPEELNSFVTFPLP